MKNSMVHKKTQTLSVSSTVAVRVSKNSQLGFVIAATITWIFSVGSMLVSYLISTHNIVVSETTILETLINAAVFPLLVFLIIFSTARQYLSILNRIFIAVLKTCIVVGIFVLAQGIL